MVGVIQEIKDIVVVYTEVSLKKANLGYPGRMLSKWLVVPPLVINRRSRSSMIYIDDEFTFLFNDSAEAGTEAAIRRLEIVSLKALVIEILGQYANSLPMSLYEVRTSKERGFDAVMRFSGNTDLRSCVAIHDPKLKAVFSWHLINEK